MLTREWFEYAPTPYKKETKKIKSKRIKNALQTDLAIFAIDQGTDLRQRFNWFYKCIKLYLI